MSNNDLHSLWGTIEEQQQEIERLRAELETERGHRQADNAESRQEIEQLRAELAELRRTGCRSERQRRIDAVYEDEYRVGDGATDDERQTHH